MATEPTELTGKVVNGVIILENGGTLPDGTIVKVEPVAASEPAESVGAESTLGQRLLKFAGTIEGLPPDMARNHNHYIHGTEKK